MKSVFIDLEFCKVSKEYKVERKISKNEIIEVGAVKLDENNHVIERFYAYVKPKYSVITPFITDLTHIRPEDVEHARSFEDVMDSFIVWIGEEDIAIYSWSSADWIQIQKECKQKSYNNAKLNTLYDRWIDFQMVFGKILGGSQQISLENALKEAGITFEGRAHSAIADAENTAALYVLTQDKEVFEASAKSILEIMKPKPGVLTSLGSFFTPEMIQMIEGNVNCA